MSEALLTFTDVARKCAVSSSLIFRLVAEGKFPAPINVAKRCSRWVESEVDHWIDARREDRDSEVRASLGMHDSKGA